MKLTLKNNQLTTLAQVLERVEVRNMKANRGRAKLFAKVRDKLVELQKDEMEILTTYIETDEQGLLVQSESGDFVLKDSSTGKEVNDMLDELRQEEVVLKGGEYSKRFMDFLDWLSECEETFSAEEILLVDDLLDQYETGKGGEE